MFGKVQINSRTIRLECSYETCDWAKVRMETSLMPLCLSPVWSFWSMLFLGGHLRSWVVISEFVVFDVQNIWSFCVFFRTIYLTSRSLAILLLEILLASFQLCWF